MRRTCPKCGERIKKDQRICLSCWTLLDGTSRDSTPPAKTTRAVPSKKPSSDKRRASSHVPRRAQVMVVVGAIFAVAFVAFVIVATSLHGSDGERTLNMIQARNSLVATLGSLDYMSSPQSSSGVVVRLSFGASAPSIGAVVTQGQARYASTYMSTLLDDSVGSDYVIYFPHFDIRGASQLVATVKMANGGSVEFVFDVPAG